MNNKQNFILAVLSKLNEDMVIRNTKKRYELLYGKKKAKPFYQKPMSWIAMAACLCLIVGTLLVILPMMNPSTPPVDSKQVPIYQGMTISNQAPAPTVNDSLYSQSNPSKLSVVPLQQHTSIDQDDPFGHKGQHPDIDQKVEENFPAVLPDDTLYYAKKNQDIYIYIHISNPDNFEILSFTLNDKKYSSYMFEAGSDMETLVLKYNVGDVEGIQSYTIDAIKYVDGEEIKDVRMDGDRTVQVHIYPENQPEVSVRDVSYDNTNISFTPLLVDELDLIAQSQGQLYAVLYDGEELISQKSFELGDTVTFDGLTPGTLYQYAIVGIYDAIDGAGKAPHVLYKEAFSTNISITFENVEVKGLTATFDIVGGEKITSLGLYQGEMLYRELALDCRQVDHLPFDIEVSLTATYTVGNASHTISYPLPVIKESEGLSIVNGVIRGFGNCYDSVLYLNHPIAPSAFCIVFFPPDHIVTEVYCGEGVTYIGANAFRNHQFLSKIVLPENLPSIDAEVFAYCSQLLHIFIPKSVKQIGIDALADIPFIHYEGTKEEWEQIKFDPNDKHSEHIFFDCDESNLSIKAPPSSMYYMTTIDDINHLANGYQIRGWVGFEKPIEVFGYYIQDESNAIYDEAFTIIGADHNDIISVGGQHALRFEVNIDFSTYQTGKYPIGVLVKFQDGTVVTLFEIPVTWEG